MWERNRSHEGSETQQPICDYNPPDLVREVSVEFFN